MLATTTAWKPVHGVFVVIVAATIVVWALAELRQAVRHRREASRAALGDELVLRVTVVAGVLVAVLTGAKVPAAAIRPTALAAVSASCSSGAGWPCASGASTRSAATSRSPCGRASTNQ